MIGLAAGTYRGGIGYLLVSTITLLGGFGLVAKYSPQLHAFSIKHNAISIGEFLGNYYGRRVQVVTGLIIIFTYLALFAAQIIGLAAIAEVVTGTDVKIAIVAASVITVGYTAFSGLRGDIVTDSIHFVVMVISILLILFPSVLYHLPSAVPLVKSEMWMPQRFGGWSFLIVGSVLGSVLPLVSMEIWQRSFTAVSGEVARFSFKVSSAVALLFYFCAAGVGFIAQTAQGDKSHGSVESLMLTTMLGLQSSWVRPLALAALTATMLSTVNSLALVLSATWERDISGRKGASLSESRWLTLTAGILGSLLALSFPSVVQLTLNAFYVLGILFIPVLSILRGKLLQQKGVFWSLSVASVLTLFGIVLFPSVAFLPGLVAAVLIVVAFEVIGKSPKGVGSHS